MSESETVIVRPAYAKIATFCVLTGLGRRVVYDALAAGNLRAVKRGKTTLVDVEAGLRWVASLPQAKFTPPKPKKAKA
jgi:hypothetical protein